MFSYYILYNLNNQKIYVNLLNLIRLYVCGIYILYLSIYLFFLLFICNDSFFSFIIIAILCYLFLFFTVAILYIYLLPKALEKKFFFFFQMKLLLITLSAIYLIENILGECNEKSFPKWETTIKPRMLSIGTHYIDDINYKMVTMVGYAETIFYIRTVNNDILKDINVEIDSNTLCNDNDTPITTPLKNIIISPVFEFIIDKKSSNLFRIDMFFDKYKYKYKNVVRYYDFCFARLTIPKIKENNLPSFTCLNYSIIETKYYCFTSDLYDIPLGICNNSSCTQNNNDYNIYYFITANPNISEKFNYNLLTERTVCTYFTPLNRWTCEVDNIIKDIKGQNDNNPIICESKDLKYNAKLIGKFENDIYYTKVIQDSYTNTVNYIIVQDDRVCMDDLLPDRYTFFLSLLTPVIGIYTENILSVSKLYFTQKEKNVSKNDVCIAAIVIYNNNTSSWYKCLETDFSNDTIYADIKSPNLYKYINGVQLPKEDKYQVYYAGIFVPNRVYRIPPGLDIPITSYSMNYNINSIIILIIIIYFLYIPDTIYYI